MEPEQVSVCPHCEKRGTIILKIPSEQPANYVTMTCAGCGTEWEISILKPGFINLDSFSHFFPETRTLSKPR